MKVSTGLILHDFLNNAFNPDREKDQAQVQQERLEIIIVDIIELISNDKPLHPMLKEYLLNSLKKVTKSKKRIAPFYPDQSQYNKYWLRDIEIAQAVKDCMESEKISNEKAMLKIAEENNWSYDSQVKRAYEAHIKGLREWDEFCDSIK